MASLTQQAYLQEANPSLARCQPLRFNLIRATQVSREEGQLTSVDIFVNKLWLGALDRICSRLSRELATDVSCATLVKGSLECITLPSEEIVAVLGVSGSVSIPTGFAQLDIQASIVFQKIATYGSPVEYTKGWLPSSGQMFGSLNGVVSHMTSYMSCGRRTGCVDGQGPVDSKEPELGYATWAL